MKVLFLTAGETDRKELHKSAREAYKSYLQAYASHQHKSIFNVNALDLQRVAPAFGFVVPPRVNLSIYCLIRVKLVLWAKKKVLTGTWDFPFVLCL